VHPSLKLIFRLGILTVSLPISGQSSYHVEIAEAPNVPIGTLKLVVLVNDSQKVIEAYHAKADCKSSDGSGPPSRVRDEQSYDALSFAADSMAMMGPGGKSIAQGFLIMPGGHFVTGMLLGPESSGCTWQAEADAIFYTDGTYEGADSSVRNLQAHRDGIVASVRFWEQILREPDMPDDPTVAADQRVAAIEAEAERRKEQDMRGVRYPGCANSPLACEYWRGWQAVDGNVLNYAKTSRANRPPNEVYRRIAQFIDRLNRKINNDASLKTLDTIFPLPSAIAESGTQSAPMMTSGAR
jgi:hypothetical protein